MLKTPLIIDLHQDIAHYIAYQRDFRGFDVHDPSRHCDIPSYRKANVKVVFSAIFPMVYSIDRRFLDSLRSLYGAEWSYTTVALPSFPQQHALRCIKIYYSLVNNYSNHLMLIERPADLEFVINSDKIGLLLALEGSEALDELSDVDIFFRLGVRSIGLTWNYDTKYASSCISKKDYGLTGLGELLVEVLNENGIIVDVAHASNNTMLDVLNVSKKPIIISHANYSGVYKHPRNVGDDVLEALVRNRGVVGFTLISSTIGKDDLVACFVKHIISVYERFGSDIIALGTDYFGTRPPNELDNISKLPSIYPMLLERGMREADVEKLAWKNAYRVLAENARNWRGG